MRGLGEGGLGRMGQGDLGGREGVQVTDGPDGLRLMRGVFFVTRHKDRGEEKKQKTRAPGNSSCA